MAATIDELTLDYQEGDRIVRKTLEKAVLSKGAWCTVAFLIQEWDNKKQDLGAPKVSIRRYKKSGGVYREQSRFNVSSGKQAQALAKVLVGWFPE